MTDKAYYDIDASIGTTGLPLWLRGALMTDAEWRDLTPEQRREYYEDYKARRDNPYG